VSLKYKILDNILTRTRLKRDHVSVKECPIINQLPFDEHLRYRVVVEGKHVFFLSQKTAEDPLKLEAFLKRIDPD
jgi:hypothetical protein